MEEDLEVQMPETPLPQGSFPPPHIPYNLIPSFRYAAGIHSYTHLINLLSVHSPCLSNVFG